ncbi:MAG: phosphoribosylanthranilate isomerase [Ruminococcaceae bacterium]|nr:phosphoribosylanthranilate isomerase [Oscillospiraceae bacterium]
MTKIKICGLNRPCDIDYVNEAGPDYAGFVLNFPQSHRSLTPAAAAALRKRLAPGIRAVGVFVDQPAEALAAAAEAVGLDVVQLHGHEDEAYIAELRRMTPLAIWKAFKIRAAADLDAAAQSSADEVLLDSGCGTGARFDWSLAEGFDRPFLLAGGLTPESIPAAIDAMHPALVDISSGVETDRVKDRDKIIAAVRAAREA